jgi:protein O-mannosyl-transferase
VGSTDRQAAGLVPASSGGWWRRDLAAAALIFGATLAAYFPALRGGFIWDDDFHVTKPALRSLRGLWLIWFKVGTTPQYYPLLHSAFWMEHRLWGDSVLGYHLVNVLLHAASACLFGLILRQLWKVAQALAPAERSGDGSPPALLSPALFGALLFALHPVCVESVAWISEQKNTLSTLFYLSAALAYLRWEVGGGRGEVASGLPPRALGSYLAALIFFIAALLSKSVTATLPAALLVVLWWKRGRLSWRRDVVPLLPWFAIGGAAGLFTAWVERVSILATGSEFNLTAVQRCLVAGRVIWFYIGKLAWPADLIFIYPRWVVDGSAWPQYVFPLAFVGLAAGLALISRRTRAPLAGLLLFAGSLFPVLGFFNVYPFKYSFVADHFQYLATLGIFALAAGTWGLIANRCVRGIVALTLLCLFGVLTWRQSRMYRDAETLYRMTIERNPGCWLAYNNLGNLLLDRGRKAEAISCYNQVLRLRPGDAIPHNNMGLALAAVGQLPGAIAQYQEALRIKPAYPEALDNFAIALRRAGRIPESIAECDEALRIAPNFAGARADRARALRVEGRLPEAIADFEAALGLQPENPETHADFGTALSQAGRLPDAIAEYEEALRLRPSYAEVCDNLGVALAQANRLPEAVARLDEAVRLKPDDATARENLGLILHAMGRDREAEAQIAEAARIRANPPPPLQ